VRCPQNGGSAGEKVLEEQDIYGGGNGAPTKSDSAPELKTRRRALEQKEQTRKDSFKAQGGSPGEDLDPYLMYKTKIGTKCKRQGKVQEG